ncbi:hypothetical protein ACJ41O_003414 [Fusarium nematophilum]
MAAPDSKDQFDRSPPPRPGQDKKSFDAGEGKDTRSFASASATQDVLPPGSQNLGDVSFLKVAQAWPLAALWSSIFSSTMILVAYGPAWITQLYGLPAFTSRFGFEYDGIYVIAAQWQSALSACSMLGQIISAPVFASLMDKYGRRPTFISALVLTTAFVFVQFFSTSLSILVAGTLLVGVSLGGYGVISLTYAMEVAPLELRGALGGLYSFGIIAGPLFSVAVSQGVVNMTSVWAYRIGYAVQWAWPLVLLPLAFFAPESPVWLMRQGHVAEAEAALRRLAIEGHDVRPDLARIMEVDRQEQLIETSTGYKDIFKGTNLRRTIIASVCYTSITITGNVLANSGAYFMILAGVDAQTSFLWSLSCGLGAIFGAFISLWILAKCRRRPIYIWSQLLSTISLFIIGFIQLDPNYYERHTSVFAQGALLVVWNVLYGAAIGPISTLIMGEVPTNALRPKTVAFATIVQLVFVLVVLVIFPYLINPEFAHLQGYIGFIAGAVGLICTVWMYFFVPETRLSTEQLDLLFKAEVGARHFMQYDVTQLDSSGARV